MRGPRVIFLHGCAPSHPPQPHYRSRPTAASGVRPRCKARAICLALARSGAPRAAPPASCPLAVARASYFRSARGLSARSVAASLHRRSACSPRMQRPCRPAQAKHSPPRGFSRARCPSVRRSHRSRSPGARSFSPFGGGPARAENHGQNASGPQARQKTTVLAAPSRATVKLWHSPRKLRSAKRSKALPDSQMKGGPS